MTRTIVIIGMGPGLSMGLARKFGQEGFKVGMISRTESKLQGYQQELNNEGIAAAFATADVADDEQLKQALDQLINDFGQLNVLQYNAVDFRMRNIIEENIEDLVRGFKISVGNALVAAQHVLPKLEETKGAILLTGGGAANYPNPSMGSVSLGKAGIKNLTYQLDAALKEKGVYVGSVTVSGWINKQSETHSPEILADKFWELYQNRNQVELVY